ncbi:MAG: YdeI/OmpD-associated family protein [Micrococcales bacterium]|uniref:YdeI/OmpD-associated family protein n=1 Tax=Phycicoccus sp. TaxID=1902410 RepID=UPI0019AA66C2|nr:YdeI/OmpD-associated family protein [Phycicoccus sp.]MBD3784297.1 YdeI/OmpD-associated family protein [Micrococcales bacterium]HMM96774.1 YdeI/OmpD-associated family protein [Phycicoccus sp.]
MTRVNETIGTPGGTREKPALFFADADEFGRWLAAHHDTAPELWMGFWKKASGKGGLQWAEAVREALCWGWIDSRSERIDDDARRQRWTPRRRGSTWSAVNVRAVEELTAAGRMQPSGLAAFAERREDRTGTYSFERDAVGLTAEHEALLRADPAAAAFWDAATPGYRKIVCHWVAGAKQQATRDSRLAQLVEDSAAGRMVKFQRYGTQPSWVARAAAAAEAARGS